MREQERVPRDVFRFNFIPPSNLPQRIPLLLHPHTASQTRESNHSRKRTEAFKGFFHIDDNDKDGDGRRRQWRARACSENSVFPAKFIALPSSSPAGCNLTKEAAEMPLVRRLTIDVQVFIEKQLFVNVMYRLNDTYLLADNKTVRTNDISLSTHSLFRAFFSAAACHLFRPLSQQAPSRDRSPNCTQPDFHQGRRVSQRHRRCEKWRQTPVKNAYKLLALF